MSTQVMQGKRWIEKQVHEAASELGIEIESLIWHRSIEGFKRKFQTLRVCCAGSEHDLDLSDTKLEVVSLNLCRS